MRVTTAFKRLLRLPGASVIDVSFGAEGVIVTVRLRRRRRVCAACGQTGRQLEIHDRRVKRWRHLDLGANRCVIECELRRLRCRTCGVRSGAGAVGAAGRAHTRDFEDVVAWLAQQIGPPRTTGAPWRVRAISSRRRALRLGQCGRREGARDLQRVRGGAAAHRRALGSRRRRVGGAAVRCVGPIAQGACSLATARTRASISEFSRLQPLRYECSLFHPFIGRDHARVQMPRGASNLGGGGRCQAPRLAPGGPSASACGSDRSSSRSGGGAGQ